MARKPKAARSNDFASSPDEVLAALSDAPAPVRRGRKPKAATPPAPLATMDSDDAAGGSADADGSIAGPIAAPVRKRPDPKPKQRAGGDAAAPLRHSAEATSGQKARASDAAPEPMLAADSRPDAGTDGQKDQQEQLRGPEPATPEPTSASVASNAAPSGSSQNAGRGSESGLFGLHKARGNRRPCGGRISIGRVSGAGGGEPPRVKLAGAEAVLGPTG